MQLAKLVFAAYGNRVSVKTNLPRLEEMLIGYAPPGTMLVENAAADE
jgi:hypothetical protein